MTSFSGEHGMATYRATVLASGLRLYAKTKMLPNRSWTPTAMLRAAGELTGKKYKRGEYELAAKDLTTHAELHAPAARALRQIS